MSFFVDFAVGDGAAHFADGGEWCDYEAVVGCVEVVAGVFGCPVHRGGEGVWGDGLDEGDSALGLVVEDGGCDAAVIEAALDDVAEAFDGGADALDVVEAGFVPFVIVVTEGRAGLVAGGLEEEPGFADGGDDAGEVAVDGGAVGVGGAAGVEVVCAAAQVHYQAADGSAYAVSVVLTGEYEVVELLADGVPVGEGEGCVGLVGDEDAAGVNGAEGGCIEGCVAVGDGHTAKQGECFLSRERMYEFVHVRHKGAVKFGESLIGFPKDTLLYCNILERAGKSYQQFGGGGVEGDVDKRNCLFF